jgi:CRP-like cAMP-binding protein
VSRSRLGHSADLIEAGELSVFKIWEDEEDLLRRLRPVDCFGGVALLDLGPRSGSVRADTDARAIEIRSIDLLAVSRIDAEQFALIYMNLGRELSRRLRQADERIFRTRVQNGSAEPKRGTAEAAPETDAEDAH